MSAVLKAARVTPLQHDVHTRSTYQRDETGEYIKMRAKKQIHLQITLESDPSPYDNVWVGNKLEQSNEKTIRFWSQNVNGLLEKNDYRELQYDIANLFDAHINYKTNLDYLQKIRLLFLTLYRLVIFPYITPLTIPKTATTNREASQPASMDPSE